MTALKFIKSQTSLKTVLRSMYSSHPIDFFSHYSQHPTTFSFSRFKSPTRLLKPEICEFPSENLPHISTISRKSNLESAKSPAFGINFPSPFFSVEHPLLSTFSCVLLLLCSQISSNLFTYLMSSRNLAEQNQSDEILCKFLSPPTTSM
jgi:hypothetical protein